MRLGFLLLAVFFIFGALNRFWNIFTVGMNGSDDFYYWETAYHWLRDGAFLTEHYRPLIYGIQSWTMKILGVNDWSLKMLNIFLDLLNPIIIIFISKKFYKNWLYGILSACIYLVLPEYLHHARSELVHTASVTFILLSFLFMGCFSHHLKNIYLFLGGFFLSCAWNTHPDLATLGLSYTLIIFWVLRHLPVLEITKKYLIFLISYFSIYILYALKFGFLDLAINLLDNRKGQAVDNHQAFAFKFFQLIYDYITENSHALVFVIFALLSLYFTFQMFKNKKFNSLNGFILISSLSYLFFCTLLFSRNNLPRLFVPLLPLVFLFIFSELNFRLKNMRYSFIAFVLIIIVLGIKFTDKIIYGFTQQVSTYKILDNKMKHLVSKDKKLLLAPITIDHIHVPMHKEVYLGGNSVYLVKARGNNWQEIIDLNNIRYIYLNKNILDPRLFGVNLKLEYRARLEFIYQLQPEDYNQEDELRFIHENILKDKSTLLWSDHTGEMYELIN